MGLKEFIKELKEKNIEYNKPENVEARAMARETKLKAQIKEAELKEKLNKIKAKERDRKEKEMEKRKSKYDSFKTHWN